MAITTRFWQADIIVLASAILILKVLRSMAIVFNLVDVSMGKKQRGWHTAAKVDYRVANEVPHERT